MVKKSGKPGVFTRESLLNFKAEPKEFIIKGYGSVFVRSIPSGERIKLQELYDDSNETKDPKISEKTVILGVCDETGHQLFTESDLAKIEALPSDLVQAMALAVVKGNGMQSEDVERAEGN